MSAVATDVFDRSPYNAPTADLVKNTVATKDQLFSVQGRVGVWRYQARFAQCLLTMMLGAGLVYSAFTMGGEVVGMVVMAPVAILCILAVVLTIYTAIKRLHDLGHSGWFYLISMIPIVGIFWSLYYSFMPGKKGDNAFGAAREATKLDVGFGILGIMLTIAVNIVALLPLDF